MGAKEGDPMIYTLTLNPALDYIVALPQDLTPGTLNRAASESVEFGGLFGYAPIMPVNQFSCDAFVNRRGRIPAPIHSFKN